MNQVDEPKTALKGDGLKNGETDASSKVTFLPEQQVRVQEIINETFRKAYAKGAQSRMPGEEIERLKTEVEGLREERKNAALYREISRFNVVNAEDVARLLSSSVRIGEDGAATVVNETGAARINGSGHPVGLGEFIAGWLSERPYFLRTAGASGAGSPGARSSQSGAHARGVNDPGLYRSISRDDLDKMLAQGIDIQGAAGQVYRFRDVKNPFIEARKRGTNSARKQ